MICKHPGNPLLHKGIVGMRFLLFGGSSFPLQRIKSSMEVFIKGASGKSPCRVRRREIPCNEKDQHRNRLSMLVGRAHLARQCASGRMSSLGGASADAQSYWQGRFAACAFVGDFLGIGRTRSSWGVAPNPTRELRPLTPQGTLSLDPFSASRLERASLTLPLPAFFLPLPLVYAPKPSTASPTAQSRRPSRPATNTTRRESRKSATA